METSNVNLNDILNNLNLSGQNSTGSKKGIYIIPNDATKESMKKLRKDSRKKLSLLMTQIVSQFKNVGTYNVEKINEFLTFYKKTFILQDFSLQSVREKFEETTIGNNEKNLHIAGLEIVKKFLSKKEVSNDESKTVNNIIKEAKKK